MSGDEKRQEQEIEQILATSQRKWRELIEIISSDFYAEMGISPVNGVQSSISMINLDTAIPPE
jgi:hypothetical protein